MTKDKKTIYENHEICSECKGSCCKNSGCDYLVSDFESMKIDYLESVLDTGRVSIVATLDFKDINGKLVMTPLLYLRARNINRDVIDLLSMKTTCASLEKNGCHYGPEDRPGGGTALIPSIKKPCESSIDLVEEAEKWRPYQKVLERLVKRYSGMSADAKLRADIEKLAYDVLTRNFEGVSSKEIKDIKGLIPLLMKTHPQEFLNASRKIKQNPLLNRTKKTN